MTQDRLKARLRALKTEPPSPDAEDRAIRAGLAAFERNGRHQAPRRPEQAPLLGLLQAWRQRPRAAMGAAFVAMLGTVATASLCALVLVTTTPSTEDSAFQETDRARDTVALEPAEIAAEEPLSLRVEPVFEMTNNYEAIKAAAIHIAAVPQADALEREQIQLALTSERVEVLLQVFDGALRQEFGPEVVEQLNHMARTGALHDYIPSDEIELPAATNR